MELEDKKIFVTGADGFIGSHLTETLLRMGCKVKALTLYNSFNNWGWLESVEGGDALDVVCGDVRDPHYCHSVMKEVDVIFHLAALIAIPYSYVAPDSYVDTNIKGTLNICKAALDHSVERVIHTSTSEVYGTAQYVPIDEKHPLQSQSPYSASKIGADAMAMSFYHAFNLPVTIARPFNTYGPRQSARAIIPTIITQLLSGKKEIKLGSLNPTRDFNYVKDIVNGFVEISKSEKTIGEVVNIASNNEISMDQLAQELINQINPDARIITDRQRIRPEKSEVNRLLGDNSLIMSLTNWKPQHDLSSGLRETIDWFEHSDNLKKYKTNIYNV